MPASKGSINNMRSQTYNDETQTPYSALDPFLNQILDPTEKSPFIPYFTNPANNSSEVRSCGRCIFIKSGAYILMHSFSTDMKTNLKLIASI